VVARGQRATQAMHPQGVASLPSFSSLLPWSETLVSSVVACSRQQYGKVLVATGLSGTVRSVVFDGLDGRLHFVFALLDFVEHL
jgi:hypothetical protein